MTHLKTALTAVTALGMLGACSGGAGIPAGEGSTYDALVSRLNTGLDGAEAAPLIAPDAFFRPGSATYTGEIVFLTNEAEIINIGEAAPGTLRDQRVRTAFETPDLAGEVTLNAVLTGTGGTLTGSAQNFRDPNDVLQTGTLQIVDGAFDTFQPDDGGADEVEFYAGITGSLRNPQGVAFNFDGAMEGNVRDNNGPVLGAGISNSEDLLVTERDAIYFGFLVAD